MNIVRELISYDQFKSKIEVAILPLITKYLEDTYKIMPKSYFVMNKTRYWVFLILTAPLLIFLFNHFLLRKKQAKIINNKKNLHLLEVYRTAMNQIPELAFVDINENPNTVDLKRYKTDVIPFDAKIVENSNLKTFKVLDKYEATYQTGLARWIRSYGRSTQVYYKATGYIQLTGVDIWPDFVFSLHNRKKLFSKDIKLENDNFNKQFEFEANDLIKARMMYTPLAMQLLLELKDTIGLSWWTISKTGSTVLIRFQPKKWYDSEIKIKFAMKMNENFLSEQITGEVVDALFLLYKLLGLALVPNFI